MKTYDLELPLLMRVLPFVVITLLAVAMPMAFFKSGGPVIFAIPFLAIVGWNLWVLTTMVYRVVVHDDGTVEWVALARRIKMRPEDVVEIRPDRGGSIGFFVVRSSSRKLRFINQITGFHEVLGHIKTRNPTVSIRGC